jgi:hypothetical protein
MPVHTVTLDEIRRRMTARRTARHHRLNLERELAAFTTSAHTQDLQATLDRHATAEGAQIREILARQSAARFLLDP